MGLQDRRSQLCLCACLAVAVLTSCESAGSPAPSTTTPVASVPPTTPPPSRTEAADRLAVESAYRNFLSVGQTFDQKYPESRWKSVLATVATEPQLSLTLISARAQKRNNIVLYGQVIPRPSVQPINGSETGTIRDCQDTSRSGQADSRTGQKKTVGIPRNPAVVTLKLVADGQWRVSQVTYPGGTC